MGDAEHKIQTNLLANNRGYDNERGDYRVVMRDHIGYRYEIMSVLGKGSFGQVLKCLDHRTGQMMAIKIIRNKKRFHQHGAVEVGDARGSPPRRAR